MSNNDQSARAGDGKSLDDERKAFECEIRCEETWGHRSLKRNGDGYANRWVNFAWDVWKERAALDAVPDVPACGPALAALQLAEELATERLADSRVANEGYPHRCVGEVRDLQTIRAGLAALAAAPAAAPAWQPIETAPRGSGEDGPHDTRDPAYVEPPTLLLWTQEGPRVGYYDWYYHPGYGRGADPYESPWRDTSGGQAYAPTHWMPLPAAPEIQCAATAAPAEGGQP